MKGTPNIRLYVRIRRADGRDAFEAPAWNRNHTLRAGYASVNGQPEHHPEGCYYLRYLRIGKRVWQSVGTDPDKAVVALRNVEHDLQAVSLGRTAASQSSGEMTQASKDGTKRLLSKATELYLA